MIEGMHAPDRNRHGIIIPPTPANVTPTKRAFYQNKTISDRHHLYFPKVIFRGNGSLSSEFREHHTNSIWLPRFQHDRLHQRYDPLVRRFPEALLREHDVMVTFLDEVKLLDEIGVCVSAIQMIDEAIYEGRVKHVAQALENRESRLGRIGEIIEYSQRFEIVTSWIAQPALHSAGVLLTSN